MNTEIGKGFRLQVHWYDNVPEPGRSEIYEGEIVGWRPTQIVIRVKGYAVLRFWKRSGTEVGNPDFARRGFKIDLDDLKLDGNQPAAGVTVKLDAE